jgi:hypothetical protein
MRNPAKFTVLAFSSMLLISSNAVADKKAAQVAIGAAIILGVAALAHNKHSHRNGKHLSEERAEADYDRGYNDALYSSHYDTSEANDAYTSGYDAGEYERNNRVSHNRNHRGHNSHGGVPSLARRACVEEASERWDVRPREIHAVKSRKVGGDDYLVEVASGYQHASCEVSGDGEIYLLKQGRT